MTALTRPIRRLFGRPDVATALPAPVASAPVAMEVADLAVDIPETDPLFAYLQAAPGPVDVAPPRARLAGARPRCATPASPSSCRWSPRAS